MISSKICAAWLERDRGAITSEYLVEKQAAALQYSVKEGVREHIQKKSAKRRQLLNRAER